MDVSTIEALCSSDEVDGSFVGWVSSILEAEKEQSAVRVLILDVTGHHPLTELRDRKGMRAWLIHREMDETVVSLHFLKGVFIFVYDFRDLDPWEVCLHVFEIHPEQAIILELVVELLLELLGPAI